VKCEASFDRLVHRHFQHIRDGFALEFDLQRLAIVAVALQTSQVT
jgi:hypothetical protein